MSFLLVAVCKCGNRSTTAFRAVEMAGEVRLSVQAFPAVRLPDGWTLRGDVLRCDDCRPRITGQSFEYGINSDDLEPRGTCIHPARYCEVCQSEKVTQCDCGAKP